jgi:hypothetical protein
VKRVAVHQPNFLPYPGFFAKMMAADVFILLDDVQYKAREWVNRNRIKDVNGQQMWLTVPVHCEYRAPINTATLDSSAWREHHLKTLHTRYARSPFYDPDHFLRPSYTWPFGHLATFNMSLIQRIADYLTIPTHVGLSSFYGVQTMRTERIVDLCRAVSADTYVSGVGAKEYLDEKVLADAGIALEYLEFKVQSYSQLWGDFIPNLSIVDMIFNVGPDQTLELLKEGSAFAT